MYNLYNNADYSEILEVTEELFLEEANWAFAQAFELLPLWSENSHQ